MIRTLTKLEALFAVSHMREDEVIFFSNITPFHAHCTTRSYLATCLNKASEIRLGRLEEFSAAERGMLCIGCSVRLSVHP